MLARPAPAEAPREGSAIASGSFGEIDRALAKAAREVRLLAAVTPANLAEQRARIARDLERGDASAPRFTYARADRKEVLRSLDAIRDVARRALPPRLAEVYLARIEELVLEARIAEAAGSPTLGALARVRFAGGDAETALRASELAAEWLELPHGPPCPAIPSDADDPGSLLLTMRREVGARRLPYAVETSGSLLCRAATGERTIWVSRGKLLTEEE